MLYRIVTIVLLPALMLSGCFDTHSGMQDGNWKEMSDWDWFSIKSPTTFREHILRDDGSIALTTHNTKTTDRTPDDYSIHLYSALFSLCSPSLTGASQMTTIPITNGKAEWGKTDLRELMKQEGYIPPYDTSTVKCGGAPFVYAFCSEKDDKTVVICINQQTDNPELAKEIFETFRWTK